MSDEVWRYLEPREDQHLIVDATLGEGGHSEMFLEKAPWVRVLGVDADPRIMAVARKRLEPYTGRIAFFPMWFNRFFKDYPPEEERPDIILFDLGISSFHYERGERGFSFSRDEELDMRLDPDLETGAADIVNEYPEKELADIIFEYGEERYSRRIAAAIVRERGRERITTSGRLKEIISDAVPAEYRRKRIHPATRSFQALRIAVNGELPRLESALSEAFEVLKPKGRIGVISFHSLEDRIVKNFFRDRAKACTCPPEWPECRCGGRPEGTIITRKPVAPSEAEIETNPRSRSAKLRVFEKRKEDPGE